MLLTATAIRGIFSFHVFNKAGLIPWFEINTMAYLSLDSISCDRGEIRGTYASACTSFSLFNTHECHHSHTGLPSEPFEFLSSDLMRVPSRSKAATLVLALGVRWTPCRQLRLEPKGGSHVKEESAAASNSAAAFAFADA